MVTRSPDVFLSLGRLFSEIRHSFRLIQECLPVFRLSTKNTGPAYIKIQGSAFVFEARRYFGERIIAT
jgi:hypothetical protein